jgi:7-carboxy-7-deazaguanine synthase
MTEELNNKYFLSEFFESIQGEGNFAGVYSLFIRFQFCNLTCTWCDTKYTWHKTSGSYKTYTKDELKNLISEKAPYHVIFTGGEPGLYRLDELAVPGKKYHVETNGTIIPTLPLDITLNDNLSISREAMDEDIIKTFNWVVSPKLSNAKQDINELGMIFWAKKDYSVFKFVIRNFADIDEAGEVVDRYNISRNRVFIMLEGQTAESQLKPELVERIIERGFNLSPRLHVLLWGNKRGK